MLELHHGKVFLLCCLKSACGSVLSLPIDAVLKRDGKESLESLAIRTAMKMHSSRKEQHVALRFSDLDLQEFIS